jgi:transcriptional regulator with XRE-family HTH domain
VSGALGSWLREQRRGRGWLITEMGRHLQEAARGNGDKTVPGREAMARNIRRWETGKNSVSERYRLHYCTAFGIPAAEFGGGAGAPAGFLADSETAGRLERLASRLSLAAEDCAEAAALIRKGLM